MSLPRRTRSLLALGGLAAIAAGLLPFGAIAEDVHEQEAVALDGLLTPLLHGLSNPTLDAVMRAITEAGAATFILPILVVACALLLWRRHGREAVFISVALAGSVAANQALKLVFHRPRPQLAWAQAIPEYSFPSGHAMNSAAFYLGLALIAWSLWGRRAGIPAVVAAVGLALLVGVSRIYLGYHYFTDVVAGFLAGVAWLLVVAAAFRATSPGRQDPPEARAGPASPSPASSPARSDRAGPP